MTINAEFKALYARLSKIDSLCEEDRLKLRIEFCDHGMRRAQWDMNIAHVSTCAGMALLGWTLARAAMADPMFITNAFSGLVASVAGRFLHKSSERLWKHSWANRAAFAEQLDKLRR